jgi:hypothetical protein
MDPQTRQASNRLTSGIDEGWWGMQYSAKADADGKSMSATTSMRKVGHGSSSLVGMCGRGRDARKGSQECCGDDDVMMLIVNCDCEL